MRHSPSFPHAQRGVALIVTLFILVVVTLMGLVAMRAGLLQVAMSTNSQVRVLLFQSADAGTANVETSISSDMTYANGPTGPITLIKDNPGNEVVGCLTKTGLDLAVDVAAPRNCDISSMSTEAVSGRDAVVVQVAVRAPVDASGQARTAVLDGTDDDVLPGDRTLVAVYSTAVMPGFGSASTSEVQTCLGKPQDGVAETVTDCLTTKNAAFETVVQEFVYGWGGYKN